MAKNVVINGVTYQDVPEIDAPLAGESGVARFLDTTLGNGATAAQIVNGYSAENIAAALCLLCRKM